MSLLTGIATYEYQVSLAKGTCHQVIGYYGGTVVPKILQSAQRLLLKDFEDWETRYYLKDEYEAITSIGILMEVEGYVLLELQVNWDIYYVLIYDREWETSSQQGHQYAIRLFC